MRFIEEIEKNLNLRAKKRLLPIQPGDVPETYADVDDLVKDLNYKPETPINVGVGRFINWYKDFYKV
jgi:UDP-glucuronate 4-epimerase